MNKLTKLARVISDEEAVSKGYANRHEMYAHLDRSRERDGPIGLRETMFRSPGAGVTSGALTGMATFIGAGAIPGVMGQLAERNINLELSARETDKHKAELKRQNAGSVGGRVLKGILGGSVLGPVGGAIAGNSTGKAQQELLDIIRANRES